MTERPVIYLPAIGADPPSPALQDWTQANLRSVFEQQNKLRQDGRVPSHVVIPRRFADEASIIDDMHAYYAGLPVTVGDVDGPVVEPEPRRPTGFPVRDGMLVRYRTCDDPGCEHIREGTRHAHWEPIPEGVSGD